MEPLVQLLGAAGLTVETDPTRVNGWNYTSPAGVEHEGPPAYLAQFGPFVFIEEPTSVGIGRVGEYQQINAICIHDDRYGARVLADKVQAAAVRPGKPWRLISRAYERNDLGYGVILTLQRTITQYR